MTAEIIIDKFGQGDAVIIYDKGMVIDVLIDPPTNACFYPPNTFVKAKVLRKLPNRGGYFISLPSGEEGFLKSKNQYEQGKVVNVLSKVYFDSEKAQTFTDQLKLISKYFVLQLGKKGISFSKKTPKSVDKEKAIHLINFILKGHSNIFVLCRSAICQLDLKGIEKNLKLILQKKDEMLNSLNKENEFYDGFARCIAAKRFDWSLYLVKEERGIFERLGIWDLLEKLTRKKVFFGEGSYLILEQTDSFYTIDVNSGKVLNITADQLNSKACDEIYYLIRILGIGGKILIDFLPCSKSTKRNIFNKMIKLFERDEARNMIWGWTKGGSFELVRERDKTPLNIILRNN